MCLAARNRGLADVCSRPIPIGRARSRSSSLTSSSSQPSSSCPSSFHPSSWPWINHLLDLLEWMWWIVPIPPGRSRRPRSVRPTTRRHLAPECAVTSCTQREAPCVPGSGISQGLLSYRAANMCFVWWRKSRRGAGRVWRTLWRRVLTVKIVGTWEELDQHLAAKTWITRSCPLPWDVRKLDDRRSLRDAGVSVSRSVPGARSPGCARRGSCSRR
jgi:hypothetical protein